MPSVESGTMAFLKYHQIPSESVQDLVQYLRRLDYGIQITQEDDLESDLLIINVLLSSRDEYSKIHLSKSFLQDVNPDNKFAFLAREKGL